MGVDFIKERSVTLLGKDFRGFKRNLMKFSQAHHSGAFTNYNESSLGMALLEHTAYVGDVLSYYLDDTYNELRQDSARQMQNVHANARQKGYKPQGKRAARVRESFILEIPATVNARGEIVPDDAYTPVLARGARVGGPGGNAFESLEDVPFSASSIDSPRMVTGSRFDQTTGQPTYFAVKKEVDCVAGTTVTDTVSVGDFKQFYQCTLARADVVEVISITDSAGNEWFEVDYLAQDMVFDSDVNNDSDSSLVPYTLKLISVPRRFIKEYDPITGQTTLTFGSGDGVSFDDQLIPNLADLALPLQGRRTYSSFPLDPQNFLKTTSLGMSPFNTTLTVTYRVGGGPQTNVDATLIDSVVEANLNFPSLALDPAKIGTVRNSIQCINIKQAEGGGSPETTGEVKANSDAYFAAQDRVVTREDWIVRTLSIPAKFGKAEKVYVRRNPANALALDIFLLAKDANGFLTAATPTLKKNISTYLSRYRLLTDGANILDGNIINLRCSFGFVVAPKANRAEVLVKMLSVARDELSLEKRQIGAPIVLSALKAKLQAVSGVVSVFDLKFTNLFGVVGGLSYSSYRFDVQGNVANEILYCPENAIFEIKYSSTDIVGIAK
jgi:hypothetical protein